MTTTSQAGTTPPQEGARPCIILTDDDLHLFAQGNWLRSWEKMGAHPDVQGGREGWRFCVWAPDVASVHVAGDFNAWDPCGLPLSPVADSGLWQGFSPDARHGQAYKYVIRTHGGETLWKADPYAFAAQCPPDTASLLWTTQGHDWGDEEWMAARAEGDPLKRPLNIYEVHLGSWRRHGDAPRGLPNDDGTWPGPGDPFPAQRGEYYTYDDLAAELPAYAKAMGYTHVELLPVMEHPFDGSWGYQPTGYFAATARFGTPQQLMNLVDACHQAGIGVILDWVGGGFCADEHGLATFNGTMLYENAVHPAWGTHKFDFGRGQVVSFLASNALFWLECFHADGIRADGVSSMLYLNFGVEGPARKRLNARGGEEDLDAVAFIQRLNTAVRALHPDVLMIAEESTSWPLVTAPASEGGLGFHLKWDMGWMNDTLRYLQTDFPWRPGNHRLLTFNIMYAFSERFVLPLSHDEVVHGKSSLVGRMPGDWWRQFAGLRLLAFYQMTHPGAKLTFMGSELAQFIEWRYYEQLEWFLAEEHQTHARHQAFTAALNRFYAEQPALWQRAYSPEGFAWIDADDAERSIVSYVRAGDDQEDDLAILINFDPAAHDDFELSVPRPGAWDVAFCTDEPRFGGNGWGGEPVAARRLTASVEAGTGRAAVRLRLPGLTGIALRHVPDEEGNPHA